MTTISTYRRITHTDAGQTLTAWGWDDLEVRFTRRSWGGWNVVRADNGRQLGWLFKTNDSKIWEARVNHSVFRGDNIDDEGYLLDEVPTWLTNSRTSMEDFRSVGEGETRE